ncbi:exocyst complex component Sec10-domain-containing protein [Sordaria brevicollis]|uniref:Exocyst complex component Sec10-domain-containing protein n=1 Tax=Sordaria brevicollis TaxID=83679 RepID=A0AAE0UCC0_SORBR|nr:exocyst complex component Sec10-domain-containing protein [Sordaria brevicollis]
MSNFKRASMAGAGAKSASPSSAMAAAGQNKNGSILNALRATTMIDSKPVLPAEILVTILDYLPVSDLLRFARTSRRMREMVYDDTRWVARLRSMGVWDEAEARRRFEEVMKRRREAAERAERERLAAAQAAGRGHNVIPGQTQHLFPGLQQPTPPPVITTTLFDAGEEEQRRKRIAEEQQKREQQIREAAQKRAMEEMEHGLQDGFETLKVGGAPTAGGLLSATPSKDPFSDPEALLNVIKNARSIRGHARQEYGKIYGALAPFYFDLAKAKSHTDPVVFRVFRDPERQAQMLANLRTFAKSDWAAGWRQREEKLATMAGIFESAVLHEFETGYEFWDVDGRMHKYAHVLDLLNGGTAAVELFIQKHPIFSDKEVLANPMDCVNQAMQDDVSLEPSRRFFEVLTLKVNEQADIIQRVFPKPAEVFWSLMGKIRDDILTDYVTPLFDETHERSLAAYVKAVSGLFEQTLAFFRTVNAPEDEVKNQEELAKEYALKVFEQHLDLYLADELDYFTKQAEAEVAEWDKKLSEQDATAESFYMGSFTNRQADKKDFLTSFKKVVMMPVSVLPSLPLGSPFASSKPATTSTTTSSAAAAANGEELQTPGSSELARSTSPSLMAPVIADRTGSPLPDKAPTDELAAKAALMTSRLEGIKSLFSIEVALSLVHEAKSSLGRAAVFIQLGGQAGGEARDQCEAIFVALLRILGGRHIKPGFDKAVAHLSQYNPREVSHHDKGGVAPLVTFIELVNVGDLISQMIDVFYEQQLTTPKIADRNDFLDPAGLAKKKFEQMLDESVAAGLNKGIDVLMDEVEYVCATTQLPTDYNPTMTTDPFNDAASISGMSTTTEGTTNTSSSGGNNRKSRYKSGTPSIWSLPSLPGTPTTPGGSSNNNTSSLGPQDIGPTATALRIRDLVASHTSMLTGSTDKSMLDVFNGEVGLRLFAAVCKHLKRQRISTEGAIKLIADVNLYYEYIRTLKNNDLLAYFKALRELSQIYLIDAKHHAKEMATIIADNERFSGVFRAEEVYEYAERRADWYNVRKEVERAMYGLECLVM